MVLANLPSNSHTWTKCALPQILDESSRLLPVACGQSLQQLNLADVIGVVQDDAGDQVSICRTSSLACNIGKTRRIEVPQRLFKPRIPQSRDIQAEYEITATK